MVAAAAAITTATPIFTIITATVITIFRSSGGGGGSGSNHHHQVRRRACADIGAPQHFGRVYEAGFRRRLFLRRRAPFLFVAYIVMAYIVMAAVPLRFGAARDEVSNHRHKCALKLRANIERHERQLRRAARHRASAPAPFPVTAEICRPARRIGARCDRPPRSG